MPSKTEVLLNQVSSIALIVGGVFFIYEGAVLIDMHRSNPSKVPSKVAVAGSLTIFLGVLSLAFVGIHMVLDGSASELISKFKNSPVKGSNARINVQNAAKGFTNSSAR